ncbi:MAG: hypothetical protein KBT22_05630 [Bacteroidales bacterium]|nr:hypothetical protein [Candidatus Scybalocola fimicaballi]
MKRFFRTLAFVALSTFAAVSISSCHSDDDDDNNSNKQDVFNLDPNRPSGGAIDQMSGATAEAFYNGLTNNAAETTIVVDTRSAAEYNAGHVKNAISIPLENDDAFYYDDEFIYTELERLDPTHSKFILITDNGASTFTLHVAGRLSAMGWGKKKIFLLMGKTSDFLNQFPDVKE